MVSAEATFADQPKLVQAEPAKRWQLPVKFLPKIHLPKLNRPQSDKNHPLQKTPELKALDQRFIMSGASLGLAASGILFGLPAMTLASIPFTLYVFAPTFKRAGKALSEEKKVNDQVLIATRAVVCLGVGYTLIASVDALLQTFSQRSFAYHKARYQQTLPVLTQHNMPMLPDDIKTLLVKHSPDQIQQLSERQGEQAAPWMFATFAVATPIIGVAHGAAFLTTTFGAHLQYLGPYTTQRFVLQGLRQNILILQPDTLNRLTRVKTLVVDANLLKTNTWQSQANDILRVLDEHQIHLISSDLLPNVLDVETYAYLGERSHPLDLLHQPAVSIRCCDPAAIKPPVHSDIILLGDEMSHLLSLFKLADAYAKSQKFNQKAPNRFDVADIGTTLLLGFGLIYSVAFTYSGLLTSAAHVDHALSEYQQREAEGKEMVQSDSTVTG